jgi:hypothetical protein
MTKKSKQAKKATKHSRRPKLAAQPEDEPDTATTFSPAEGPESVSVSLQTEAADVPVESQQAPLVDVSVAQAAGTEAASTTTRGDAAKANIKEGLRLHQIAGRPNQGTTYSRFRSEGLPYDLAKTNGEIRHHTRNISGCSSQGCAGYTTRPRCPDRS